MAPLGPDGKSINLHHTTQRNESSIEEVTQTSHKENSAIIHINPNTIPSGVNRSQFNKWRTEYWKYLPDISSEFSIDGERDVNEL
ncbi:HNH/ENDO VII family nuclease [Metabacillus sp. KIGAM252]|uniref:HNH/ENDO VII family nuclease n=1 Tax=Metabacillus flavus TaxID=2823519 RepID=A0ABS5LJ55_9BACI|nr:HNH/ENDO VII family nuclease [Metabacillus flavus]